MRPIARLVALSLLGAVAFAVQPSAAQGHGQHGGQPGQGMTGCPMMGHGMGPGMMGQGVSPGMMGPGMMGQGMGPGMMGPGMMGQGMGPGMMGPGMMGQGMGPGMMGPGMMGQGMGPGMMGPGMMGQGMGPGMMGPGMTGRGMGVLPQDLSVENVQHMLEHQLAWQGNPNLKLGKVEEKDEDTIVAEIVTQDGSLVQRLQVDRHTGMMQSTS